MISVHIVEAGHRAILITLNKLGADLTYEVAGPGLEVEGLHMRKFHGLELGPQVVPCCKP